MAHLKACNDRLNLAQSLQKKQNKQTKKKNSENIGCKLPE